MWFTEEELYLLFENTSLTSDDITNQNGNQYFIAANLLPAWLTDNNPDNDESWWTSGSNPGHDINKPSHQHIGG